MDMFSTIKFRRNTGVALIIAFGSLVFGIPRLLANPQTVRVGWDKNAESIVKGYKIHIGTTSGAYDRVVDAGNSSSIAVGSLEQGVTYYIAATTYNADGTDSVFSDEITYTPVPRKNTLAGAPYVLKPSGNLTSLNPSSLTTTWTVVSGPSEATIDNPADANANISFGGPGTYRVSFSATDGVNTLIEQMDIVVGDTFNAWRSRHGIAARGEDTDLDGMPAIVEYAMGTDPKVCTPSLPMQFEDDHLAIVFTVQKVASDVTVTVEVASSPEGPWNSGAGFVTEEVVSEDENYRVIRALDSASIADHESRYMRVVAN